MRAAVPNVHAFEDGVPNGRTALDDSPAHEPDIIIRGDPCDLRRDRPTRYEEPVIQAVVAPTQLPLRFPAARPLAMPAYAFFCRWTLPLLIKGQTRTSAKLFDHFVGGGEQRRRDGEVKRLGHLEIDHKLELSRRHDRQIGGLSTFKNPPNILAAH